MGHASREGGRLGHKSRGKVVEWGTHLEGVVEWGTNLETVVEWGTQLETVRTLTSQKYRG